MTHWLNLGRLLLYYNDTCMLEFLNCSDFIKHTIECCKSLHP